MINEQKNYLHTCCFTGHRPEKLKLSEEEIKAALRKQIDAAIADGFTIFICGMARGVDLWAAKLVLDIEKEHPHIKLLCAVPYYGFEKNWPLEWQGLYHFVLLMAYEVKVFYPTFSNTAFQERNRWMVNNYARIIAVYNGSRGGTRNTLAYAKKQHTQVCLIKG